MTPKEQYSYDMACVQVRVLNILSHIKFRDNDNFNEAISLMHNAINLRIDHHVDVVHLVQKWLSGKPNALRSVNRELPHYQMAHLYNYRDNPTVRKVIPNGLYGDTIKPHLKKE